MSECDHHISSRDTTTLSSVPSHKQQYTNIHNNTQQDTTIHSNTQQTTTIYCKTQQYTTIHNNTPQYTAIHNLETSVNLLSIYKKKSRKVGPIMVFGSFGALIDPPDIWLQDKKST